MNGKLATNINKHIQENFWLYIISLICVFTGIVIGIYAVKYMSGFEKSDLTSYLKNFTQGMSSGSFSYKYVFIETLKNNIILLLAIWFLGLTMIGLPIIIIIDLIKGFTIGFTICFMINGMGVKGIGVVLLGIVPQNIIYIPCLIISSVLAMEFSLTLLKDKISRQWITNIWMRIMSYSAAFAFIFLVMTLGFLLESYVSPNMIKLVVSNIGAIYVKI